MSFRGSQSDYENLMPPAAALGGDYGTAGGRTNIESLTPPDRYGPPPLQSASLRSRSPSPLCGVPSLTLRRMIVGVGLLWIGGVAYISSMGRQVLRAMEEQRKMNLAAMAGRGIPSAERLAPIMGSSDVVADTISAQYQQAQSSVGDSSSSEIRSDTMGTFSSSTKSGGSTGSSSTSSTLNRHSSSTGTLSAKDVTILVVYGPEFHSYIWTLAWQVALGVNSAFKKHAHAVTGRVVFGTTANLTFADVMNADAVLVGSPVYNGNTHPDVQTWINYWRIESDLSRKIGGAFVTAGGMHSGAEGTLMSLMRSMMVFRMMTVGGDTWDSPFGAAATVYEDPFGDTRRSYDFSSKCYQTDSLVHPHFLRKAWDLGERVANVTFALKNSSLWNAWG
eukprot:CAMPEP_0113547616 /NCGR_PEP_ID=MMETSP0015_2-20120614/12454_1 /TAXON_ID=2838 /ORGANISM="Odontella" /LENGTH=390 /DNA_ID=CAMNT_0000448189 /DNA_START=77 /DNA_END=1249 /DNA_ORIENTATION=+ /assembly_acc=CAM_ASM_000160